MTRPLQPGDPASFGPFTVDARLADSPAGVVFLGCDDDGKRAAIATLAGPAAEDPAMQTRFKEAADPAELYDGGSGVRVLAASLDDGRPWVATAYDGVRPGAERVFEELSNGQATSRYFQPFTQYPAESGFPPGPRRLTGRPQRPWWWWGLVLTLLLGLLILLMFVFFRCGGGTTPQPTGTPTSGSGSPNTSQTGSQSPSSGSPSQSQSGSGSQSPSSGSPSQSTTGSPSTGPGSGSPGTGTGDPTGAPLDLPGPPGATP